MKKSNKILKASLAVALIFGSVGALAGCKKDNETAQKTEQEKVYDLYVAYMSAKGETPQTYEEWLVTIKGQKGEKGDKGDTGEPGQPGATGQAGATWYTGEGAPGETVGKTGDLYLNTATSDVYKKGETAWSLLTNIKGGQGNPGQPGQPGQSGGVGQPGATGNGISDVDVIYEYDDKGTLWAVFTITYTEGDPQVIRTVMPKRITHLSHLTINKNGESLSKFAKLDSNDNAPQLYVQVQFDDNSMGYVKVTEDMFEEDIDFTTVGNQSYSLTYFGQSLNNDIEIVDLSTFEGQIPTNVDLVDQTVTISENLKNIIVRVTYGDAQVDPGNVTNVLVPLTAVAENYISETTNQSASTIDLTTVDKYTVTLKDAFEYEYHGYPKTLYLLVYNPIETTINHFQFKSDDGLTIELGAADYEETIKNTDIQVWLFEENEEGENCLELKVKDLNYDLSDFNVNMVGEQAIPVSYQIEGQSKAYEDVIWVRVEANLEHAEVVKTYTVDPSQASTTMMMFNMMHNGSLTLYNNGIATSTREAVTTQFVYEIVDNGQTLKIYDSMMSGYAYYSLDTENNYIKMYTPTEGTPTDYSLTMEMMEEIFETKLSIYGTEGSCKGLVTIFMSEADIGIPGGAWVPYAFVDCTWLDENTISSVGRTFNVTTGNVLVEVTE